MPRLSVGVYATSASTPLYFAQAIGRFVRARRRGELASIFVPSVPLAARAGDRARARARSRPRPRAAPTTSCSTTTCSSARSSRMRHRPTFSTSTSGPPSARSRPSRRCSTTARNTVRSPNRVAPRSGISSASPGILEPDEVSRLLRSRQARQRRHAAERPPAPEGDVEPAGAASHAVRAAQAAQRSGVDPRPVDRVDARPGPRRGAAAVRWS